MENERDISSEYPSVDLAYDFVKSSYDIMVSRFEAANSRIQNLMTWAIGITAVLPLFSKIVNDTGTLISVWFFLGLAAFVGVIVIGIIAQRNGGVALSDPKLIFEKQLHYTQWEFKKNQIFWAGKHFHLNKDAIDVKSRWIDVMTVLLGLEIALALLGIATT